MKAKNDGAIGVSGVVGEAYNPSMQQPWTSKAKYTKATHDQGHVDRSSRP